MTFLQDPDRPGGTCFLKKQVPTTSLRPEAMSAIKLSAAARPLADAGSCIMSGRLSGDLQWAKRVVASDGTGTERGADVDKGRYSLTLPAGRHTVVVSAGKMSVVTTPPAREVDCTGAPIQGDFRIDRYDEG